MRDDQCHARGDGRRHRTDGAHDCSVGWGIGRECSLEVGAGGNISLDLRNEPLNKKFSSQSGTSQDLLDFVV
jgi:hypothetical protein